MENEKFRIESKFKGVYGTIIASNAEEALGKLLKEKLKMNVEYTEVSDPEEANVLVTGFFNMKRMFHLYTNAEHNGKHLYDVYIARVGRTVQIAENAKSALFKALDEHRINISFYREVHETRNANACVEEYFNAYDSYDGYDRHLYFVAA